jgi:probable rRNA maturation factor
MIHVQGSETVLTETVESWLRTAAQAAFDHEGIDPATEITVALVEEGEIQRLNQEFLGIDSPTDVLSFPADEVDPETRAAYRGDVIIAFSRAQTQAENGEHTLEAELKLLTVHGVLHLLGYDHAEPAEKDHMWQVQSSILRSIGNQITGPSMDEPDGMAGPG